MASGSITVTLPENVARDFPPMAARLVTRMHELLERNTDGQLTVHEREELEGLVEMAEFVEVFSAAVRQATP